MQGQATSLYLVRTGRESSGRFHGVLRLAAEHELDAAQ
jgi:hypothetical protein